MEGSCGLRRRATKQDDIVSVDLLLQEVQGAEVAERPRKSETITILAIHIHHVRDPNYFPPHWALCSEPLWFKFSSRQNCFRFSHVSSRLNLQFQRTTCHGMNRLVDKVASFSPRSSSILLPYDCIIAEEGRQGRHQKQEAPFGIHAL
jgi:hypothetical protein